MAAASDSDISCQQMKRGPEITPRRRAAIVALHHPQLGVNPLSFRKIAASLGVPKATCRNIYKHALKNAAAKQQLQAEVDKQLAAESYSEGDKFLAGIDAQLDSLYTELAAIIRQQLGFEEEDEGEIPLLELICHGCVE
ncbi:hypothetical protein BDD12DRAFT_874145 [Trichophaea hybrida]|nr:hypothetical protein BDD12DRAFT_874145 [Trichophaea hybrida]